jgi:osmotically-inducible protein OsmY
MRNGNLIIGLVAGGVALAATNLTAQSGYGSSPAKSQPQLGQPGQSSIDVTPAGATFGASDLKASSIIGLAVRNESDERLGKVQDLIVCLKSHSVPFAIVGYGGTLGIGQTRVAVPLTDLQWSDETKELILTATKEQFQSASAVPTGGYVAVAGEDWAKSVDRFYGQPSMTSESRYERQEATGMTEGREPVRTPAEQKGATSLQNQPPGATTNADTAITDDYVMDKVNGVIRQDMGARADGISVTIKNGVATLQGKVASEAQKQEIENQVKAVPGVDRVDDQLMISPE